MIILGQNIARANVKYGSDGNAEVYACREREDKEQSSVREKIRVIHAYVVSLK